MLQLPPTIRTARPDEVPSQDDLLNRIAEREKANIVEGFILSPNENQELPFIFFAEINVDNENLWPLFRNLLLQLPDEICLVYNYKDGEPFFSGYGDKYEVLNKLEPLKVELAQDGFLELGALYNDESFLEEVFIRGPKYLQYWGMDEERFRQTMAEFEIYEVPGINFIDQYPLVTEALCLHNAEVKETNEVFEELRAIFPNGE